jgi:hypothetical protein
VGILSTTAFVENQRWLSLTGSRNDITLISASIKDNKYAIIRSNHDIPLTSGLTAATLFICGHRLTFFDT